MDAISKGNGVQQFYLTKIATKRIKNTEESVISIRLRSHSKNHMTTAAFKVSKLSMRLSRDGFVSYNCEIRKGRKTYAFVDQEGIGGSEHIYGHANKAALQEVKDWIWENCRLMFLQYQTQVFLLQNNLETVEHNDPKLLEFLKPLIKAWRNKEESAVTCDNLIGWWTTMTAENKYYK